MPFPPNLGITSALIIDSRSPILLPDFSSLFVPHLHRANMNAYSRIGRSRSKSKSLDFADLSFLNPSPTIQGSSNINSISTPQSYQQNDSRSPLPEHRIRDGVTQETLGIIHEVYYHQNLLPQSVDKKKRVHRRSASLFEGYTPIHQQFESITEDVDQQEAKPYVKKKVRFFKACKRLFGL